MLSPLRRLLLALAALQTISAECPVVIGSSAATLTYGQNLAIKSLGPYSASVRACVSGPSSGVTINGIATDSVLLTDFTETKTFDIAFPSTFFGVRSVALEFTLESCTTTHHVNVVLFPRTSADVSYIATTPCSTVSSNFQLPASVPTETTPSISVAWVNGTCPNGTAMSSASSVCLRDCHTRGQCPEFYWTGAVTYPTAAACATTVRRNVVTNSWLTRTGGFTIHFKATPNSDYTTSSYNAVFVAGGCNGIVVWLRAGGYTLGSQCDSTLITGGFGSLPHGVKHCVSITYNHAASEINFYKDGVFVSTHSHQYTSWTNTKDFSIGCGHDNTQSEAFKGTVHELSFYSGLLPPSKLASLCT